MIHGLSVRAESRQHCSGIWCHALSSVLMSTGRKTKRTWTGKPASGSSNESPGAAPGTFLSDFAMPDLAGRIVRVSDQLGHPYVLLFVSSNCKHSHAALRELARSRRKPDTPTLPVIVTVSGGDMAAASLAAQYALGNDVVAQEDKELLNFYRVPATPAAYFVDATRRTVGPLAIGSHDVIGLLRGKSASVQTKKKGGDGADSTPVVKRGRVKLDTGTFLPSATLAAPEGYSIDLHAQIGRRLLILLWSENCPFCTDIVASAGQIAESIEGPDLVVVGRDGDTGPPELPNALFGTQDRRSVSVAFGLRLTPAALLIDASGRLERPPAEGSAAVMAMLSSL